MQKFRWKEGRVVSVRLKDGSFNLAQLLYPPYFAFFKCYSDDDRWSEDSAETSEVLFICAATKQFTNYTEIHVHPETRSRRFDSLPTRWIEGFHGGREVVVWKGTSRERTILMLESRPGGRLIEMPIDRRVERYPVIMPSIDLDDAATIDGHETTSVWTYPNLNERLYLSKIFGRSIDPGKDLQFERPPRDEYATYMDILSCHGKPEDWGYSSKRIDGRPTPSGPPKARVVFDPRQPGFPFKNALDLRHDLEDEIAESGVGEVVHATSSPELMELDIELKSARSRGRLEKLLDKKGLTKFVKLSFE